MLRRLARDAGVDFVFPPLPDGVDGGQARGVAKRAARAVRRVVSPAAVVASPTLEASGSGASAAHAFAAEAEHLTEIYGDAKNALSAALMQISGFGEATSCFSQLSGSAASDHVRPATCLPTLRRVLGDRHQNVLAQSATA